MGGWGVAMEWLMGVEQQYSWMVRCAEVAIMCFDVSCRVVYAVLRKP